MAGMSKRHFEALAAIIKAERADAPTAFNPSEQAAYVEAHKVTCDRLAYSVATMCRHENPLFDRARFLAACGVEG